MSVSKCTIAGVLSTYEHIDATGPISTNTQKSAVLYDGYSDSKNLTPSSSPTVTEDAYAEVPLVAGAATLDLTNVTTKSGRVVNFNTLKIRSIKCRIKAGNANFMLVKKGAANGYTPVVGQNFEVPLPANANGGAWLMVYDGGGGSAVSGTNKTIDITGTGTQVLEVAIAAGT